MADPVCLSMEFSSGNFVFVKASRKNLPKHVCSTVRFLLKALLAFFSRENVCFDRLKWATHTWIQYLDRDQLLAFH